MEFPGRSGDAEEHYSLRTDRPTLTPPFDPAAFARESESTLRARAPISTREIDEESGVQPVAARVLELDLDDPLNDLGQTLPVPVALAAVPFLAVSRAELARLTIDHRAGFILSHVDGLSSIETILDVSAMPSDEALRILAELTEQGIITLR